MMKAQLKDWGITDAKIVNASGLNNSYLGDNIYPGSKSDEENTMSAKDVAIIAQHVVKEYPEILDITKKLKLILMVSTNSKPSTICSRDNLVTVKEWMA